ncbi:hypothetical protein CWI42_100100 [Ordospora colligata]|uniref:UspA domain-containing protein n=1 Tax=Ordospora colligata OC4 TaxID=1354746 RepID=A0A0B2UD77_9MICR|nr:uncharacterized protein M896_100100 [Ordospora colligata OC4]KHN69026.1 hypothetical protein M896_100100 [Ordospora colligata OC4]TBU14307.1 hypothetical protein CWI40_100110 [Ordospora colligata]TBU14372.1 hypothetical protein CWI41_100110 [Ordospora colligata]TBU17988.1 hypothetical protein CWI42_100100 [Ordospora colligata]
MNTIAVVLNSIDYRKKITDDAATCAFLCSAKHIVLIFMEKNSIFLFNDPRVVLESEKLVSTEKRLQRKAATEYLHMIENSIKRINLEIEVSKLVICGDEKYKVRKCLECLGAEAVVLISEPRGKHLYEYLISPLEDYIFEMLQIPVIKVPIHTNSVPKQS